MYRGGKNAEVEAAPHVCVELLSTFIQSVTEMGRGRSVRDWGKRVNHTFVVDCTKTHA